MELLIAILMYLGILSPEATATMSTVEIDAICQQNRATIEQVISDQGTLEAAGSGIIIDRRED